MNEHGYNAELVKRARDDERFLRAWKVNDDYQSGVPDMYFLTRGGVGQYEGKWLSRGLPKRDRTIITPDWNGSNQRLWLGDLFGCGVPCGVVIGWMEGNRSRGILLTEPDEWDNGVTAEWARAGAMGYGDMVEAIYRRIAE